MPSTPAPPDVVVALRCPCGVELSAAVDAELVETAHAHLADAHPRLAGAYTAEDVLSLAYRRPAPAVLDAAPDELEP